MANFTVGNVIDVYKLAALHSDSALENACIEMMSKRFEIVEDSDKFKQLDSDMKVHICSSIVRCVKTLTK